MSKVTLEDLDKAELQKFIKFAKRVLKVCPEEDIQAVTSDLEKAESLLKKLEDS